MRTATRVHTVRTRAPAATRDRSRWPLDAGGGSGGGTLVARRAPLEVRVVGIASPVAPGQCGGLFRAWISDTSTMADEDRRTTPRSPPPLPPTTLQRARHSTVAVRLNVPACSNT